VVIGASLVAEMRCVRQSMRHATVVGQHWKVISGEVRLKQSYTGGSRSRRTEFEEPHGSGDPHECENVMAMVLEHSKNATGDHVINQRA